MTPNDLTLRDYFAGCALQGLLEKPTRKGNGMRLDSYQYRSQQKNDRLTDRGPSFDPPDEPEDSDFSYEIESQLDDLCSNKEIVADLIGESEELIELSVYLALASATFVDRPNEIVRESLHRAANDLGAAIRNQLRPRAEKIVKG